jgi:hypothetical protein
MAYFLCVFGLALVLEGLPYFAFPVKMQSLLKKLPDIPARNLRLYGIGAISIGLLIIYIAQNYLR